MGYDKSKIVSLLQEKFSAIGEKDKATAKVAEAIAEAIAEVLAEVEVEVDVQITVPVEEVMASGVSINETLKGRLQ
jgi:molybdenum cofactor biosynthesis enzyme MoaA